MCDNRYDRRDRSRQPDLRLCHRRRRDGGTRAGIQVSVRSFKPANYSYCIGQKPYRLSEDADVKIGVLEAGEWHQDVDGITIPGTPHASVDM